jgi:hypothetical protein
MNCTVPGANGGDVGGYGAPAADNMYLDVQPGEIVVRQLIPSAQVRNPISASVMQAW